VDEKIETIDIINPEFDYGGWTFDILAIKKIRIGNKEHELILYQRDVNDYVSECKVSLRGGGEKFTPEEFALLKKEKLRFVQQVNEILRLK